MAPDGEQLACRAPWSSLHLDQMGDVRPCCQSTFVLGNVGVQGVQEIWAGTRADRLREAVSQGDLSLGCGFCEWAGRDGGHESTYARRYDELPLRSVEDGPARLEIAPSNTCNLQCTMCNGEWSSAIRSQREHLPPLPKAYGDDFFVAVEGWLDGIGEVELFGGEPLLARESLRLLELMVGHDVEARVTTNGTIWNDRVERLVDALQLHVVVSIDGASRETYEAIRVGARWDEVQENLRRFRAACDRHGTRLDLAHCLMVENWWELPQLLAMAAELRAPVFVNTVLSPVSSSLHHLSPPELQHVVRSLEARRGEVEQLGEPWLSTWDTELGLLRASLADAAQGRLHAHLGGADGSPGHLRLEATPPAPGAAVRRLLVQVDRRLSVEAVRVVDDHADLPPLEVDDLVGRPSSVAVQSGGRATTLNRRVLEWSAERTVEERVHASPDSDGLVCERRVVDASGPTLQIEVEQHLLATEQALREQVVAAAGGDAVVVELDVSESRVVTAVVPSAAVAGTLGLAVDVGVACVEPADVLAPERQLPAPEAHLTQPDPLTTVGTLRWPDGSVVALAARQRFDGTRPDGSHVYLAGTPASAAAPPPG